MKELAEKLKRQNELMRKDILEMLPYAQKGGVAYFTCLNCGMPTYRGQSACELCPIDENGNWIYEKAAQAEMLI